MRKRDGIETLTAQISLLSDCSTQEKQKSAKKGQRSSTRSVKHIIVEIQTEMRTKDTSCLQTEMNNAYNVPLRRTSIV